MTSLRLKGAAFLCRVQSGLKATCATLRFSAQQAAMRSAPLGARAMEKNHVGMLGAHLVERRPDARVIVAVGAARESDAWTGWQHNLRLGGLAGVQEIAAVDHG